MAVTLNGPGDTATLPPAVRAGVFHSPAILVTPNLASLAFVANGIPVADYENKDSTFTFVFEVSDDGVTWVQKDTQFTWIGGHFVFHGIVNPMPNLTVGVRNYVGQQARVTLTIGPPMTFGAIVTAG